MRFIAKFQVQNPQAWPIYGKNYRNVSKQAYINLMKVVICYCLSNKLPKISKFE